MNTIEIQERNITATYPSGWEEMTDTQFYYVMKQWLALMDGKINEPEFYILVLYHFLGIKISPLQHAREKYLTAAKLEERYANIWQLVETITWLLEVQPGKNAKGIPSGENLVMLTWNEVRNRFPEMENDYGITLAGPSDALLDITFAEYRRAMVLCERYNRFKRTADMDRFIATLYRPVRPDFERLKKQPDFDGNRRERFNPALTEHYAALLEQVPFWKKYAIYVWFHNCDKFLKEEELELGGKKICFSPLFTAGKSEDDPINEESDLGLTGLLFQIGESGLFGTVADVDRASYIDVLTALLMWKQQADKLKRKIHDTH